MSTKSTIGRRGLFRIGAAGTVGMALPAKLQARQSEPVVAEPVWLFDTHVAGTKYYDCESALPDLAVGSALVLRREPSNSHDDLAIEILTLDGMKLGYVPRRRNTAIARLMDAGWVGGATVAAIDESMWDPVRLSVSLLSPR